MRRQIILLVIAACTAILGLSTSVCFAQTPPGFALNQFQPTPAGDRFFAVVGADPGPHLKPRFSLLGEYAMDPLVAYENDGDDRIGAVVSDLFVLHAAAAIGFWDRIDVSIDVPVVLGMSGDDPVTQDFTITSPSGTAMGDVRGGLRLRLVGEPESAAMVAIGGYVWVPTGDENKLAGDGSTHGMPYAALSGIAGNFVYAATAGIDVRSDRQFLNTSLDNQLAFGVAAGLLFADKKLQIGPELYGTTAVAGNDSFGRDTTNLEAILGAKYRAGPVVLGAAAGPGFTDGVGTPSLRALVNVAYAPLRDEPEAPADRDGDGILDRDDACPDDAGLANEDRRLNGCPDRDGDGIFDIDDACVDTPGVRSDDKEKNGCPLPKDRDGDGVVDSKDACPNDPGPPSDDPESNGCPDVDADGIVNHLDACPELPGVATDDKATNGCPPDTDGDGIRDDHDACPREKGKPNDDPEKNGCPSLVRVTKEEIKILEQVQFETAKARIRPESEELLKQVSEVLGEHPEIELIEVQGHTDNRGSKAFNQRLSEQRANSVVEWLTTKGGIDASRLVARGFGPDQPIAENNTAEGRQLNRRVQFKITKVRKKESDSESE